MLHIVCGSDNTIIIDFAEGLKNKLGCEILKFPEDSWHPYKVANFANELDENIDMVIVTHSKVIVDLLNARIKFNHWTNVEKKLNSIYENPDSSIAYIKLQTIDPSKIKFYDLVTGKMKERKVHTVNGVVIKSINDIHDKLSILNFWINQDSRRWYKPQKDFKIFHKKWYEYEGLKFKILDSNLIFIGYNTVYLHKSELVAHINTYSDFIKFKSDIEQEETKWTIGYSEKETKIEFGKEIDEQCDILFGLITKLKG